MAQRRSRTVRLEEGGKVWIYEIWSSRDSFQRRCWAYLLRGEPIASYTSRPVSEIIEIIKKKHPDADPYVQVH